MSASHSFADKRQPATDQVREVQIVSRIKEQIGNRALSALPIEEVAKPNGLADQFVTGEGAGKDLNSTQLRKIFHELKDYQRQIKLNKLGDKDELPDKGRLALLQANLAYARGRELIPDSFYYLLVFCLEAERCKTKADFDRLVQLLEAILAYHKYHSKKKGE
jgi:CRISPR-associated protein Csm2